MAKKRSFKKLREHLTSNDVDKKIEYLESRMPTNNTALVFQGDPSNPQGNSFETIVDGEENEKKEMERSASEPGLLRSGKGGGVQIKHISER